MDKNQIAELLSRHLRTWSETDPEIRKASVQEIYAEDIEVVDPIFSYGRPETS